MDNQKHTPLDITFQAAGEQAEVYKKEERNGLFYLTKDGIGSKDTYLSPEEKKALADTDKKLVDAAQWRATTCGWHDCNRAPVNWALQVKFDLKHESAAIDRVSTVEMDEFGGELAGFCPFHLEKVSVFAQLIFYSLPETKFGFKPTRWMVLMTDGSYFAGNIEQIIVPFLPISTVVEEYIPANATNE